MDIIRKDATITNTDESGPGSFEVILSAPTKDRDGETLLPEEWKQPLPDHITFDSDHGMSVATTVGSGVPSIDEKTGNLIVSGTYSSLPRAQEVRTLVNEGHIRTTSVAFMSEKTEKDGNSVAVRELLNGAFVAIPSNREALVLNSKSAKAGSRNSAGDLAGLQGIHDTAASLGADCSGSKSFTPAAVDGALKAALASLATLDPAGNPAEVTQAINLLEAANLAADESLGATGVPDPDEDQSTEPAQPEAAAPAKAAAPAETKAADDEELRMRAHALSLSVSTYTD